MQRYKDILPIPKADSYNVLMRAMQFVNSYYGLNHNFNDYLFNFRVNTLNEDQLNELVNTFKRPDGQYVYKAKFLPRDKVYEKVRADYCELAIDILEKDERVKVINYEQPYPLPIPLDTKIEQATAQNCAEILFKNRYNLKAAYDEIYDRYLKDSGFKNQLED